MVKSGKAKKGSWFMVRVTVDDDELIKKIFAKCDTIVCKEISEEGKIHYHSVHTSKYSTIARRLVENGLTGNECKAFTYLAADTDEHWDACLRYICKGYNPVPEQGIMPTIIINTINVDVEKYHNDYFDPKYIKCVVNSNDKQNVKKTFEEQDEDRKTRLEDMYNYVINERRPSCFTVTPDWIISMILDYYHDHKHITEVNDFQLTCYAKSIWMQYHLRNNKPKYEHIRNQRAIRLASGLEWGL